MTPIYSLQGVTRRYGSGEATVYALDDVDMEVGKGEFVAVVGSSGSGKSTLLQMLGALDRPSAGRVTFEGSDLANLGDDRLAEMRLNRIGFVFQHFNLIPVLTAAENVEAAMAPRRKSSAERRERSRSLLGRVGLGARVDHLPSQLSGGEQQRVAIARALANEPDVLLADEPTGNLDSANGRAVLELIRNLWAETGLTIVLITHDRAVADEASRRVELADGRIFRPSVDGSRAVVGAAR